LRVPGGAVRAGLVGDEEAVLLSLTTFRAVNGLPVRMLSMPPHVETAVMMMASGFEGCTLGALTRAPCRRPPSEGTFRAMKGC
jgi:hypothetical protein